MEGSSQMRCHAIAVAFGIVALTVACAQTDTGVTASVKSRLATDDTVKGRNINVDTKEQVVTLTGQVQTEHEQRKAIEIARTTNGVVDVVDELAVMTVGEERAVGTSGRPGDSGGAGGVVLDPGITADVRSRLLSDSTVKDLKIEVDTEDRVVILKGKVDTEAQKTRALGIARSVDNVARVEDKLTVRNSR
jgi:hyperosmotically inducible periplasmic protein